MVLARRQARTCDAVEAFPIVTLLVPFVHVSITANSVLAVLSAGFRVVILSSRVALFTAFKNGAVTAVRSNASWSAGGVFTVKVVAIITPLHACLHECISALSIFARSGARAGVVVIYTSIALLACIYNSIATQWTNRTIIQAGVIVILIFVVAIFTSLQESVAAPRVLACECAVACITVHFDA